MVWLMKVQKKKRKSKYVKGWRGHKARMERWESIQMLLLIGHSLSEIGQLLRPKLSKQRVYQISKNYPKLDPDRANLV